MRTVFILRHALILVLIGQGVWLKRAGLLEHLVRPVDKIAELSLLILD